MKKITFHSKPEERKLTQKTKQAFTNNTQLHEQLNILNRIYLDDALLCNKDVYLSELKKKWQGYKQQDMKHNIFHESYFIEFDSMIQKMVASKLRCTYCTTMCYFIYDKSYQNSQWTLDRIDNNKGHTDENTVISCLQCNLSRGNIDYERFKNAKKISIIRKLA